MTRNNRATKSEALTCADAHKSHVPSGAELLELMAEAENYNQWLLNTVETSLRNSERLLDFGAGRGQFAIPLRQRGRGIECVEPNFDCRGILEQAGITCHADLTTVGEQEFDGVYTLNVLEHIEDDYSVLCSLHKCLKPRGALLVYVPAFNCLYTSMDRRVGHVRRYRLGELCERIAKAGFRIERASYADSLGFFATLLYRAIGNANGTVNVTMLQTYDRFVFPVSKLLDHGARRIFGKNLLVLARRLD